MTDVKKITFKEIRDAAKIGYNATVTINGETYIIDPSNDDFINGILFAAAYIIDNRSRRFFCWKATQERKRTPKKELEQQLALNHETRFFSDCLQHLTSNPRRPEKRNNRI